jgi:transcriptional regulator GlxA family with amidase domain
MPCGTSIALRNTTGLILEFFLCALFGQDRLSKARFYTFTGLSAGLNISLAMIQQDYGVYVAASVGQTYCPEN